MCKKKEGIFWVRAYQTQKILVYPDIPESQHQYDIGTRVNIEEAMFIQYLKMPPPCHSMRRHNSGRGGEAFKSLSLPSGAVLLQHHDSRRETEAFKLSLLALPE